jgi:hypothetical protein
MRIVEASIEMLSLLGSASFQRKTGSTFPHDALVWDCNLFEWLEAAMYVVIRRFNRIRSVTEAARRAESGIGHMLKQSPGFQGYYVFDAGDGVGGSVTLFETKEAALAANEQALAWIRGSLIDVIDGEPEITIGEVLVTITN